MTTFLELASIAEIADQLFARLTERGSGDRSASISSGRTSAEHPLSHGQRALWFLHQLDPQRAAYNMSAAARIPGDSDIGNLRRALQTLVDRRPSLRTTFIVREAEPVQ